MARASVARTSRGHARRRGVPDEAERVEQGERAASADHAITRLSSKNQITLPVAMVRALGMKAGDEINMRVLGDTIYVSRRPQTPDEWVAKFAGSINVPGWETKEQIDAYIKEERDSWTREGDDF